MAFWAKNFMIRPMKNRLLQILPALAIILTVFGFAHWFCYLTVVRSVSGFDNLWYLYLAGIILMLAGFISSRARNNKLILLTWCGYVWMGFFTIHLFLSLVETVILQFVQHSYSYWIFIASIIISVWALYKGLKFPATVTHFVSGPETIKNFKIAQISDLHVGLLHLNQKWLEKIVCEINFQKPDIVVITGDLAEGDFERVSKMLVPLKNLKSNSGIFYITGNHEYIHPGDWEGYLQSLGITSLHNQNKVIEFNQQKILVAGIPDKMAPRFNSDIKSLPDVALKSDVQTIYKILLAHEPSSISDLKTESCDLMLTGHTHGGQIFPFHFFVRLVQPMIKGFKKYDRALIFNHQGTGLWGPPMRWFSQSEIVILLIK